MNKRQNKLLKIGSLLSVFVLCGCSYIQPLEKHVIKPKMRQSNVINNNVNFISGYLYSSYDSSKKMNITFNYQDSIGNVNITPHTTDTTRQVSFRTGYENHIVYNLNITDLYTNPTIPLYLTFNATQIQRLSSCKLNVYSNYLDSNNDVVYGSTYAWLNSVNNSASNIPLKMSTSSTQQHENWLNIFYDTSLWYNETNYILTLDFIYDTSGIMWLQDNVGLNNILSFIDIGYLSNLQEQGDNIYQNGFNEGLANGIEKGKAEGRQETIETTYQGKTYQQIYNTGYSDGETAAGGASALIPSLFGAIVNIPISILNGLVPLTFFDISIIRVALTFLALGVVMWIIRKVLI